MPGSFLEDDLPIFFDTDDHGYAATWNGITVNGIYTDEDLVIDAYNGEYNINVQALFTCAKSSVQGIKQGDPITINGKSHLVKIVPSSESNRIIRLGLRSA